ncbi:MAG TPA: XrtA/PEP-CTERM system TPR-repeat protein PrsT [Burkholderiaceae bacterium]
MTKLSTKTIFTALVVWLLVTACTGATPDQQVKSAKDYLKKNDTKSATIQIKNALQQNPALAEPRFLLGTILLNDGNASAAEIEFRKALAAKYPDGLVVPELARAMLMMGQANKVVDEFGKARFDKPAANAELQTTLVAAYGALGKPELAQAALNSALTADPDYAPALIERARQLAVGRDFDGALLAIEAVISKNPVNADAWKLKGDILLYGKSKADDALVAYRKSIDVKPDYGPGHIAVLTVLMQQGKLDAAASQLAQLKRFAANNPQTKYVEAQLAYQRKDFKLARDLSQQLLRNFPNNPLILQLAGAVELQLNSFVQAEIYLTRATQAAPNLALARRLLIATYLRSGQSAKALAALKASAGADGLDPGMYSLAGEAYLQNGDAKKAQEYFAKALTLDPDNADKRTALAITHLASGQTATAFDELQNIAETDKGTTADLALISAHLRRNEFDQALVAIDKLEAKQPDKPLAANLRGRIQLAQNDKAAARKSFERALAIDPSYFAAAASLASLDMADKKPDDARKRFETLLAQNPKNGQALLGLAQLAAATGAGKDEIAKLLSKAVEANPDDAAPRLLLVELFLRNKDTEHAITTAQNAVAALPNSAELLEALGRVQQVSGDPNQAIATYTKLAALQPLSPVPQVRLAEAYVANKNNRAAERSLRKALEIKPDMLDAQRGLIILSLGSKMYQDALTIARTVQSQRPESEIGLALEGDIDAAQKDWSAAATAYRTALQKSQVSEVAIKLHAVTVDSGKAKEAEQFATTWMAAHPKDSGFPSYLGAVAIARKDYAAAEKSYRAMLQIRPDDPIALNNLAYVTLLLHKEGALAYAEKANKLVPNQPDFMDTLASVLSDQGEYSKAAALLLKAIELQPTNAAFRLNLAKVYLASGDKSRAKSELDTLAKRGDKDPLYPEVTALLKTL